MAETGHRNGNCSSSFLRLMLSSLSSSQSSWDTYTCPMHTCLQGFVWGGVGGSILLPWKIPEQNYACNSCLSPLLWHAMTSFCLELLSEWSDVCVHGIPSHELTKLTIPLFVTTHTYIQSTYHNWITSTFLAESSNILSLVLSSEGLSRSKSSSLYSSRKETRTENSWTSCRGMHTGKYYA